MQAINRSLPGTCRKRQWTSIRMDILVKPGSHVQWDWYKSHEGREVIMSIMHRNLHQRKVFGLLERPSFPPHLAPEEYRFKIFVCGKSGVGKTSTISKLSGNEVPSIHSETPGIQTTEIYWPVKILQEDKVVMFQLQFWDAGENALKKFDHVLPACKDQADAVMFVFSFVDKSGFEDLPQQMSRVIEPQDNVCRFIMGTKYDLHAHSEIMQRDIRDFEQQWRTPVLRIKNITDYRQTELRGDLNEVAPILNTICEHLWHREQILQGRYSIPVEV